MRGGPPPTDATGCLGPPAHQPVIPPQGAEPHRAGKGLLRGIKGLPTAKAECLLSFGQAISAGATRNR